MLQPKVYIKSLEKVLEVEFINFGEKTVEVYDDDYMDIEDPSIGFKCYSFDEVKFLKNTGYKDKNGNCICEYDIVKYHDDGEDEDLKGSIFVVVKEHGGTSYYLEDNGINVVNLLNSYKDITVIGNIYENKELLKNE